VAEGDTVVTRWRLTGTHLGKCLGKEATGNEVNVDGVSINRIKGGMVVSSFDA
jgi:predicted ester cyclase